MIEIIADNIISPLGISSKENYENVKAGVTGLQKYEHKFNLDFAFTASLMPEKFWEDSSSFLGLSRFEKMAVRSVQVLYVKYLMGQILILPLVVHYSS